MSIKSQALRALRRWRVRGQLVQANVAAIHWAARLKMLEEGTTPCEPEHRDRRLRLAREKLRFFDNLVFRRKAQLKNL